MALVIDEKHLKILIVYARVAQFQKRGRSYAHRIPILCADCKIAFRQSLHVDTVVLAEMPLIDQQNLRDAVS